MRLCILGGTGNAGRRLVRLALERGHQVTAPGRDPARLPAHANLTAPALSLDDPAALAAAMRGHDAAINAAGNVHDRPTFAPLVQRIIAAAAQGLGPGGRFWFFGGGAALDVPGTTTMTVDLPKVPQLYRDHRANLAAVRATALDWSMLCPGPMIDSPDGRATAGLRLSADSWPVPRPFYTRVLPPIALSLAFGRAVGQMTIYYEDAAAVILDHLDKNGRFSRRRVGIALPPGMNRHKDYRPNAP